VSVPKLVRTVDPWLVPVTIYEIETPSPEENVALALSGMAGALREDRGWSGKQRLLGSVKLGQIDYALVRRRPSLEGVADTEHNPFVWSAMTLLRGSVREHAGVTHVRLVFSPGYLIPAFVLSMTAFMAYQGVRSGSAWELMVAPAFAWLGMLAIHRAALRRLRPHAFAALGLPAR
jgi:hypothetical protein